MPSWGWGLGRGQVPSRFPSLFSSAGLPASSLGEPPSWLFQPIPWAPTLGCRTWERGFLRNQGSFPAIKAPLLRQSSGKTEAVEILPQS